jgi:thiol-disulfide isomerase/thioredoxin
MAQPQRKPNTARQRQPARRSRSFWQGPWPIIGTLGGIVVLIVAFIVISRLQSPASPGTTGATADPAVVSKLSQVSPSVVDAVGTGGTATSLTKVTGSPLTGSGGKSEVLYVGAEWCPYCAAERWAMVVALSHFGSFSGLGFTSSSGSDVFPNTRTLSFAGSSFASQYIDFVPIETEDRNHKTLQSMNAQQQQIAQTYDPDNSIPFLDFANQYTMIGQGVAPDPLQGLSWPQIANALSNPDSPVTKAIVGNANYVTSAICKLPSAGSAPICSDSTIKQIEAQLPS